MTTKKRSGLFESQRVLYLPVEEIVPNPSQPRTHFVRDGLEELAASIAEHGILQPLSVREVRGRYQLISGERRLRAARLVGLTSVPCILVEASDTESALLALVENLQRRDLDFLEEAMALRRLIVQHGLSQEEAARKVGKSQSAVANKLRLLKLSPAVLDAVKQGGLTERHARSLLRLPEEQRLMAAQYMAKHALTVAKAEEYVDRLLCPSPASPSSRKASPCADPSQVCKQPRYLIRDVRFFLNSIDHSVQLMQSAGVGVTSQRDQKDGVLTLTLQIPMNPEGKG
jgi:ParB family chromosome partitioning protein